jgi:DNA-binding transcriptional regulator YhcF (GntR family)
VIWYEINYRQANRYTGLHPVFEQIRRQILSGELMPGFRLPPKEKLAESLGINRSTVFKNAYRELKRRGLSSHASDRGTVVLSFLQEESVSGQLTY